MPITEKVALLFILAGVAIPMIGVATIRNGRMQKILHHAFTIWSALLIIGAAVFIVTL